MHVGCNWSNLKQGREMNQRAKSRKGLSRSTMTKQKNSIHRHGLLSITMSAYPNQELHTISLPESCYGIEPVQNQLFEILEVLEVGCSFGQMTALLAKKYSHLAAMDISPQSVQLAEKRLRSYGISHVRFAVDDADLWIHIPIIHSTSYFHSRLYDLSFTGKSNDRY